MNYLIKEGKVSFRKEWNLSNLGFIE